MRKKSLWASVAPFATKCLILLIMFSLGDSYLKKQIAPKPVPSDFTITDVSARYLKRQSELMTLLEREQSETERESNAGNLYILSFNGDTSASQVAQLRQEITTILSAATEEDTILVIINSAGGTVNGYGLAAAQLERIKASGVKLVTSVDRVAASGGYMMAAVGDELIAAPFAYVGSVGVVASFPNFSKVLDKAGIDYDVYTAGESKRNVGIFKENTEEDVAKLTEQLERVHSRFAEHVVKHRPEVEIAKVATGDYWMAKDALELALVDSISTSDEYIVEAIQNGTSVYAISTRQHQSLMSVLINDLVSIVAERIAASNQQPAM